MVADSDAIIIGAGHNGLVCGIVLAKAGWDVLILEQNSKPGGACKSGELTEPGFIHDHFATNVNLFLNSPFYEDYGDELHNHGFDLATADQPYASVFPDGDGLAVHTDSDKTRTSFEQFSENDARAWSNLVEYFQEVSPYLFPFLQMPLPSLKAGKHFYRILRELGVDESLRLASMLLKSPREFTEYWFENEKVKALFIPWAFHLYYGPDVSGGAMFPFIESVADHLNGMALPHGGAQTLTDSLVSFFEKEGGTLRLEEDVEDVIVQNRKAVGVRTASGRDYRASRAVVGNVTPDLLFTQLVDSDHLAQETLNKAERFRYGPGTVMVHLALREPLDWRAGEGISNSAYVHIAPYVDDVARTYQQSMAGLLPDSPMLVVGQPTAVDPSRSPEDKHVLWIQVRAVPSTIEGDAAGSIQARDWKEAIEPFTDRVIDKLETYAPDVREKIIDQTTLGPLFLESDNPNLAGGDSLGGSHHLDQHWVFRPFPDASTYSTPIDQLYLCGASTWPGAGLNATSGYLLARQLSSSTMTRVWNALTS